MHYPGLQGHPQAALAKKQMREGTVVSFDLKQGSEAARNFSEKLKLFALTASLGSTDSLVMPPQLVGSRDFTPEQLRKSGVGPGTVRLSIGLEDVEDLDLRHRSGPGVGAGNASGRARDRENRSQDPVVCDRAVRHLPVFCGTHGR